MHFRTQRLSAGGPELQLRVPAQSGLSRREVRGSLSAAPCKRYVVVPAGVHRRLLSVRADIQDALRSSARLSRSRRDRVLLETARPRQARRSARAAPACRRVGDLHNRAAWRGPRGHTVRAARRSRSLNACSNAQSADHHSRRPKSRACEARSNGRAG